MERRLVPINALVGLATPSDVNPAVLADAGYVIAAVELPIQTAVGVVVIDIVLANGQTGHLLATEAKSGANVDAGQARRYSRLDAMAVAQASFITLKARPTIEPVYTCLPEHMARVERGLASADVAFPILVVEERQISLVNDANASEALRKIFTSPARMQAPPQRLIPFDQDSPVDVIRPAVNAALIASLAQGLPQITLSALAEKAAPHFGLLHQAQGRLRRKVAEAARLIADQDAETFLLQPRAGNQDGFVRFLRSPEERDPRGRTQAYQALGRGRDTRGRPRTVNADQLDLLAELDDGDDRSDDDTVLEESDDDMQEKGQTP